MRARDFTAHADWGFIGVRLYPYQLAFGVTVAWWPPGLRGSLHLGPIKLHAGLRHTDTGEASDD